ncbi:MAG: ROK family protein [Planctomycetes bacterium]|nr:ROK family protein [Planctomycetota bacterium]
MNILSIDIGGTHVKIRVPTDPQKREFDSGPTLTPRMMVDGVKALAAGWHYDAVSIGIPAPIKANRPLHDPVNLGKGWTDFDYDNDFGLPVKILNDAAMQAVGSYNSGSMLFLGLGTGLGSCFIAGRQILPMELAHLPYKKGRSFEDYVGLRGLKRLGKKKWRTAVADVVHILSAALIPDEVVLGGGNSRNLKELPAGCRLGDNANAFEGGFRLWEKAWENSVPIYHDAMRPNQG